MTVQTESRSRACMTYAEVKPVIDEVNNIKKHEDISEIPVKEQTLHHRQRHWPEHLAGLRHHHRPLLTDGVRARQVALEGRPHLRGDFGDERRWHI